MTAEARCQGQGTKLELPLGGSNVLRYGMAHPVKENPGKFSLLKLRGATGPARLEVSNGLTTQDGQGRDGKHANTAVSAHSVEAKPQAHLRDRTVKYGSSGLTVEGSEGETQRNFTLRAVEAKFVPAHSRYNKMTLFPFFML